MRMLCVTALLACVAGTTAASRQVHVAFGKTDDTLSVAWVSQTGDGASIVKWGTSPQALTSTARGDVRLFSVDAGRQWFTRTALMGNLTVGGVYYYQVGDTVTGFSEVFKVRNRRQDPPYHHVLFGDMGAKAAFSLCVECTEFDQVCDAATCKNTSVGLVSEVDWADMFLHVGDFAYDLEDKDGTVGDQFMANIEQVAARVPYMVSHGNHEDSKGSLAHYLERFRSQPVNSEPATFRSANGVAPNTMYFSWNYGMIHYVAFSTELFHGVRDGDNRVTTDTMLAWLEADLRKANLPENRAKFPWIVVHGHRPLYSSSITGHDATVRAALEPLFFKYGVSFSINGHQHDYERSWPTYKDHAKQSNIDPTATIYIVTGAAGSHEMHTPYIGPQPAWSAFRSNTFGYTRFVVHNSSHLHLQQVQTDPSKFPRSVYGRVIDDVWIVQHHQGPFSEERAPKTLPKSCPPTVCQSHDHFAPLLLPMLGEPHATRPLHEVIAAYRRRHGEHAWAQQLKTLLKRLTRGDVSQVEWEDGLLDKKELDALRWIEDNKQ